VNKGGSFMAGDIVNAISSIFKWFVAFFSDLFG